MGSQIVTLIALITLLFGGIVHSSVLPPSSYASGEDFAPRDLGGHLGGHPRRSIYTDSSAFIPYIHPRFVLEQDFPGEEVLLPPQEKRATKGMLVDVVDFVTKGSETRNQRMAGGQGMRSSGRRRR
ncbi:uncharacterized protein LOC110859147 [Folsomia candida]|uniref:uncharacterized protein LOC110859147 n=1 Tax=Folsomia candida TaxID=158441 RepID=UPI000B9018A1|nr:uncharacterized protein LOC110859147 [Folsomia candida]